MFILNSSFFLLFFVFDTFILLSFFFGYSFSFYIFFAAALETCSSSSFVVEKEGNQNLFSSLIDLFLWLFDCQFHSFLFYFLSTFWGPSLFYYWWKEQIFFLAFLNCFGLWIRSLKKQTIWNYAYFMVRLRFFLRM